MILIQAISRAVSIYRREHHSQAFLRIAMYAVLAVACFSPPPAAATVVRMETNYGNIDIELYDDEAPITVRNFLTYAAIGYYNKNIIHRSVPGFVIQGGGYTYLNTPVGPTYTAPLINKFPPIRNEFSPSRSNLLGTIAMAKVDGDPNSATSQWFFNLADNSANLDSANGGFTVFGKVLDTGPGTGMDAINAIAALVVCKAGVYNGVYNPACTVYNPAFTDIPVVPFSASVGLMPSDLALVNRIPNVAGLHTPSGNWAVFAIELGMEFKLLGSIDAATAVPWLALFTSPPNQSVHFNNGMYNMKVSGAAGAPEYTITMYDGAATRPNRYYAYGRTLDNQADHWYDFTFDGMTGAEFKNNRIVLHFVDGERGDNDLVADNSISHIGAQAVVTTTVSTDAQSGGCSIASTPSQTMRGGDWSVVSLFLGALAFVRRRARRQIQRWHATNIASP